MEQGLETGVLVVVVVALAAAGLCFGAFGVSYLRDRRKLRNGFYLFFALIFLLVAALSLLAALSRTAATVVVVVGLVLVSLAVLALAVFLVGNGVTMMRREGRGLANALSLLAGIGLIGLIVLNVVAPASISLLRVVLNAVFAYVAAVFGGFLLYSSIYGRLRTRRGIDFVVVLGAGLRDGRHVPPLLASRLRRTRRVFATETARGGAPLVITSGGQGPDEKVPESRAMAERLVADGVPADRILLEDRSRTTAENLSFSASLMRERKPGYRCVVVTNNFHVLRTALMTRRAGINAQVVGAPTAWYFWPSVMIREFVAVVMEHKLLNVTAVVAVVALRLLLG